MAIYHLSAKLIQRSQGQSSTAASAYRAGVSITDERTGVVHDYQRKRGVSHDVLLAPDNAPDWAHDRTQLWNHVEQVERRQDAQLAREIEVALPRELDAESMQTLVKDFAQTHFVEKGMVADIAYHHLDSHNPHAHILLTTRDIDKEGFGKKNRSWNDKSQLHDWREGWQRCANQALEKEGHSARIDHRSLQDQGQERLPTKHVGHRATALERRGVETERGDYNRKVEQFNAKVIDLAMHRHVKDYHQLPDDLAVVHKLFKAGIDKYLQPKLAQAERLSTKLDEKIEAQNTQLGNHQKLHPDPPKGLLSRLATKTHEKAKELWQKTYDRLHHRLSTLNNRLSKVTDYVKDRYDQRAPVKKEAARRFTQERPAVTLKMAQLMQREKEIQQAQSKAEWAARRARERDQDLER